MDPGAVVQLVRLQPVPQVQVREGHVDEEGVHVVVDGRRRMVIGEGLCR